MFAGKMCWLALPASLLFWLLFGLGCVSAESSGGSPSADAGGDPDAERPADLIREPVVEPDLPADTDVAPVTCNDGSCTEGENAANCPEDCPAICGDTFCTHGESATSCGDDCPAVCEDRACTHDETAGSCPADCPPACPDGYCSHSETAVSCAADCPAVCQDGSCTHDETAESCPWDCPPVCGDEFCTHDERAQTCPDDCPNVCGDTYCTHDETVISCPQDCPADCGDDLCSHTETAVSCPADCPAQCGDEACTHGETTQTCPDDCPSSCGDTICSEGESAINCPGDCSADCGDNGCTHDETAATCPEDCPSSCGDDACTHLETVLTCPQDCESVCGDTHCTHLEDAASCPGDCPAVCGDTYCTHLETVLTCQGDCPAVCGDGYCTHDETYASCSLDCPPVVQLFWLAGSFIDLSLDPGAVPITTPESGTADDGFSSLPIGFDFPFYGASYNVAYASSNGLVTFGSGSSGWDNQTIPTSALPNAFIAPFWDDLNLVNRSGDERDGRILYATRGTAPNRYLVIQWQDVAFYSGQNFLTFEVILHENGLIQMLYHDLTGQSVSGSEADRPSGGSATIGVENATGTAGLLHSFNTAEAVRPGTILVVYPDGSGGYALTRTDNLVGEFLDIRSSGTSILELDCDDCLSGPLDLGFSFDFYGVSYTQARLSTNGWLGLGTDYSSSTWINTHLPNGGAPRPVVACLWDDGYGVGADSTAQYATIGDEGNRIFVAQFTDWHFCCADNYQENTITFQIRLHEATGIADCVYGSLATTTSGTRHLGSQATVGIQDAAGAVGVEQLYEEGILEPGDRIAFYPRDVDHSAYLGVGPDTTFIDIRRSGTLSTALDDDAYQSVALPFPFDYYGTTVNQVTISSNGHLSLNAVSPWLNTTLPNTSAPAGLVGPYWDDLDAIAAGIYYETRGLTGDRLFIVQWDRLATFSTEQVQLTFEVILWEADNSIEFVYGPLLGYADSRQTVSGGSATIGLQSPDRTQGIEIGFGDPGTALSGSWFLLLPE
ncbi:MAG: hypothetical protein JW797_15770 [Bradymonadales bacterium]|nr:hypothetical protein [Bradymonadales bacterium]